MTPFASPGREHNYDNDNYDMWAVPPTYKPCLSLQFFHHQHTLDFSLFIPFSFFRSGTQSFLHCSQTLGSFIVLSRRHSFFLTNIHSSHLHQPTTCISLSSNGLPLSASQASLSLAQLSKEGITTIVGS